MRLLLAVQDRDSAVLSGSGGDQRVGDGHAVVSITALSQLAEGYSEPLRAE